MKVILTKDVENVGDQGDIVNVKDGFARNYLLPRKLALSYHPSLEKWASYIKNQRKEKEKKLLEAAKKKKEELEKVELSFSAKAGEEGKLYGSITSKDIENALSKQGFTIDKKHISISQPIKKVGKHTVKVRIYKDILALLHISVEAEEKEEKATAKEP